MFTFQTRWFNFSNKLEFLILNANGLKNKFLNQGVSFTYVLNRKIEINMFIIGVFRQNNINDFFQANPVE